MSITGTVLVVAAALASVGLAGISLTGMAPVLRRYLSASVTALLFAAFLAIGYFHVMIAQLLPLKNPFDGSLLGTYKIPPWIESEKLLFWALILSIMALAINRRHSRHRGLVSGVNIVLAVLAVLMAAISSPFSPPLPGFHSEILAYQGAIASQNPQVIGSAIGQTVGKMIGYYNSTYMWTHPPLLLFSYAAFSVTFVGSILMFRSRKKILDQVAFNYGRLGFIVLSVGLLLGYPWALIAWKDQPWWWDPKINMSIMMWVFFGAYLHARLYKHKRRMWVVSAALGTASFVALAATYLTTYVIPGIHSVAG